MNTHRFVLCLTTVAGLLISPLLGAGELSRNTADTIRAQGRTALTAIQAGQYQDMLDRSRRQLMLPPAIIVPSPLPRAAIQIRLQGKLALFAIREQLLAEYRTGFAARHLASRGYRVRALTAADNRQSGTLEQAKALFKSTKFEWPEFMPRGLR